MDAATVAIYGSGVAILAVWFVIEKPSLGMLIISVVAGVGVVLVMAALGIKPPD